MSGHQEDAWLWTPSCSSPRSTPTSRTALDDYAAIKAIYHELDLIDTFDAAVVTKNADGKVTIVKRHEQPTRTPRRAGWASGWRSARWSHSSRRSGSAPGCLSVARPAQGSAPSPGMPPAASAGPISRNSASCSTTDESGFVLVAATDMRAHVLKAISRAQKRVEKDLKADAESCAAR